MNQIERWAIALSTAAVPVPPGADRAETRRLILDAALCTLPIGEAYPAVTVEETIAIARNLPAYRPENHPGDHPDIPPTFPISRLPSREGES